MVPFVQFKKREKHPWRSVTLAAHHIYAAVGYIFRILMHGYFLARLIFKPDGVKGIALRKFCF